MYPSVHTSEMTNPGDLIWLFIANSSKFTSLACQLVSLLYNSKQTLKKVEFSKVYIFDENIMYVLSFLDLISTNFRLHQRQKKFLIAQTVNLQVLTLQVLNLQTTTLHTTNLQTKNLQMVNTLIVNLQGVNLQIWILISMQLTVLTRLVAQFKNPSK